VSCFFDHWLIPLPVDTHGVAAVKR
jgi:hypothetical protein